MKPPIPDPFEVVKPFEKVQAQPIRWNPDEQCFFVVYGSHTAGRLRCLPKEFVLNPVTLLVMFLMSPMIFSWVSGRMWPLWTKLLLSAAGSFAAILLITVLQIVMQRKRPRAVAKIVQGGLRDEMAHKIGTYSWSEIKKVRNWNGDLFFMVPPQGCYFCRESFQNRAEADAFFSIAERLWKSNGAEWENLVRQYATRAT